MFSVERYVDVLNTYIDALASRADNKLSVSGIASVASFFLSRIDVKVDAMLDELISQGGDKAEAAQKLRGQTAIASAAKAYSRFTEIRSSDRWTTLQQAGANCQRLLWASTSSKDPAFSDIKYIEALIASDTVNTVPWATLNAYRDHGEPKERIAAAVEQAPIVMLGLADLGIDLSAVDQALEDEGIVKFVKPYESLLGTLGQIQKT